MYEFSNFIKDNATKKNNIPVTTSMMQHPTGFMYMDYGAGTYLNVYDDDEVPLYEYHNVGITSGSVNVLISKSQGGKTTLAIEMAVAIIEPFINDYLYHKVYQDILTSKKKKNNYFDYDGSPFIQILDTEKTLPIDYAKKLARYTNKLTSRHLMINPITTDRELMQCLASHVKYKVDHMNLIPMPMPDIFGKPIMTFPPTVIIIDSMSQLLLEDCDDPEDINKAKGGIISIYENNRKNTSGAQRAKIISALYSQLVNYAKRYNIIIFSINHINKMPAINGIPVKQYRGLKGGETIGGGERAIYLAANILRLDVIKAVGTAKSTFVNLGEGVTGHIAIASWIKSKSNSKANTCQLVYTNESAYDSLLSNLWNEKEKEELSKSGNYYYIKGHEDHKFTFKNYKDVFADHPELFSAYYDELRNNCSKMLDNPEKAAEADRKLMNKIRDDIHSDDDYSGSDIKDMDDMFSSLINS